MECKLSSQHSRALSLMHDVPAREEKKPDADLFVTFSDLHLLGNTSNNGSTVCSRRVIIHGRFFVLGRLTWTANDDRLCIMREHEVQLRQDSFIRFSNCLSMIEMPSHCITRINSRCILRSISLHVISSGREKEEENKQITHAGLVL